MRRFHAVLTFLLSLFFIVPLFADEPQADKMTASTFSGLEMRSIGPALASGRITDFAVNPDDHREYYVAVASGNVWKTSNAGVTYRPVFDQYGAYSIGCVTIDPNNPHTVWVGTGENNSQRSVGYGDGVYKSVDGGKSWKHMGLKQSEHIAKIIVHPQNANIVYVASQGPLWGPGGDRGVFKTTDGGKTWQNILDISKDTGVTDLVMDPRDPDVMYAASYQRRRRVWTLINGGPESALYKTTDGGANWKKLTSGIPSVDLGRIGLAISPANPDVIYAIIEAAMDKGGFFRSTDRGASWHKQSGMVARSPQYYQEIVADPEDVDRVYSLDTYTKVTVDGGKTFETLGRKHRHVDDHAMWIDPENPEHLLIGGDGGIYESYDRGANWHFKPNIPITQFYRVAVDSAYPFYNVYGGTQDNNTIGGPARTTSRTGIVNCDWFITKGGDGFEPAIDPENPDIVYSQSQYGWLARYDKASGQSMGIKPIEGPDEAPLRWNWNSPLFISPHDPQRLYFAANKVFRSDDRGDSWTAISPDLTRQIDRNKLEIMGRVWSVDAVSKNASTSLYGNIVSLTESPLQEGLLYAGTDDGLIQITEDRGKNWRSVERIDDLPKLIYISDLLASRHDANTVYAAFDNHKSADFAPYIYKSTDRGRSWKPIAQTLPDTGTVYALSEDHVNPDLLFAGTEFGVYFTVDGGKKWIELTGKMPTIAVRDIAVQRRENDLVLGTFGRSFYVLDNYAPLRHVDSELLAKEAHLFGVRDPWMFIRTRSGTGNQGGSYYAADNPPFGATFTYYLKEDIKTLKEKRREREKELLEAGKPVPYPSWEELRKEDQEESPYLLFTVKEVNGDKVRRIKAPVKKGIHRVSWDLRFPSPEPTRVNGKKNNADASGMLAMPGKYEVTLSESVNGKITQLAGPQIFEAKVLGTATLPAKDREALVAFQRKVADLRRAVSGAIKAANEVQDRLEHLKVAFHRTPQAPVALMDTIKNIEQKTEEVLRALRGDPTISKRNANQPPSVQGRLSTIVWGQWRSTSAPTESQRQSYQTAAELFKPQLEKLQKLIQIDLHAVENTLQESDAPWTPGRIPKWDGQ